MKKILLGLAALTMSITTLAQDKFGVGVGVGVSNVIYKGAGDKTYPMPLLDINYGDLYIKGITVGYNIFKDDVFAASLFVDPLAGFTVDGGDMAKGYDGIDDRKFQVMFGARLDANTGFYGIRTGLSAQFGEHGSEGKLSAFKPYRVTDKLTIVPAINITGYSGEYTDYYFGVTSDEARKSHKIHTSYKAKGAYSFGVNLTADYNLTDRVALMAFLGVQRFSSEITDSPIVEDDVIYLVGVGAKYYF